MDTLKNNLSMIKSLLSPKSKEDLRHGERVSESFRFTEKETMGYPLPGKSLA